MMKIVTMLVLLSLSLGAIGCEERVVGTRNDWVGSQYHPQPEQPAEPEKDFGEHLGDSLRGTGEFLFGWTGLTGGNESRSNEMTVTDVEPADRMTEQ